MIVHVALDGLLEGPIGLGLDIVGTAARLARAGMVPGPVSPRVFAQTVVSVDGQPATSLQRRPVAVDGAFVPEALGPGDVVVVPGAYAPNEAGVDRMLARPDVRRVVAGLREAWARGAMVTASCSGTFLLGAAGLLDGGPATTTWWLIPVFRKRFSAVELRADRMVVEGERVITAGAALAHADLLLAVVTRVATPLLGHLAARYLVLEERSTQSRYMLLDHLSAYDPLLERVEAFVMANLARQVSLEELAHAAGTSTRTLARRVEASAGVTPQRFVQRLRMAQAAHLLETTRVSVDEVAARVGYADPAAFRRAFRRHTGETPRGRRGQA